MRSLVYYVQQSLFLLSPHYQSLPGEPFEDFLKRAGKEN